MRGKRRPQSDRTRALGIALLDGPTEASRQTGIPHNTISQWMQSPEYDELRQRTKDQVAEEWWAIVQQGFRRVQQLLSSTEDVQKVATATAIVTDKMLLIRGEATARSESKDITHDLNDHESEQLGEIIRTELARRADQDAAQPPVESPAPTGAETA